MSSTSLPLRRNVEQSTGLRNLRRGLEAAPITMIVLGATIGTGLIIGSSSGLKEGGPLGLLIGYGIMGFICYAVVTLLGEMAAYLPHRRGLPGYASRFWHPAVGFAVGWAYVANFWMFCPIQINMAVASIQNFTVAETVIDLKWLWIFIVIAASTGVNILPIKWYGRLELYLSTAKVISLIGLILFGIIFNTGGVVLEDGSRDRIGFRYWGPGQGPFGTIETSNQSLEGFLIFTYMLVNALFAYSGAEIIGVVAGEAQSPRRTIPRAVKQTFWTIFLLYIVAVIVIGVMVPSRESNLNTTSLATKINSSPFVIAAEQMRDKGTKVAFNAIVLVFALSASCTNLYISSRALHALACERQTPWFLRPSDVTPWGVPYKTLFISFLFSFLSFLSYHLTFADVINGFSSLATTFTGLVWVCLAYTYIRFRKAMVLKKKELMTVMNLDEYWKPAPFQPWAAWIVIVVVSALLLLKGISSMTPGFDTKGFVLSYIGLPVFGIMFLFWWLKEGDRTKSLSDIDLVTGVQDEDEDLDSRHRFSQVPPTNSQYHV